VIYRQEKEQLHTSEEIESKSFGLQERSLSCLGRLDSALACQKRFSLLFFKVDPGTIELQQEGDRKLNVRRNRETKRHHEYGKCSDCRYCPAIGLLCSVFAPSLTDLPFLHDASLQHHHQSTSATSAAPAAGSTEQQTRPIQTSSIPVSYSTRTVTHPSAAFSDSDKVIAFSSGSTPALSLSEQQKSVLYHHQQQDTESLADQLASGTLSPLREFLKRRQAGDSGSNSSGSSKTTASKHDSKQTTDAESILASLLLPSVKGKRNSSPDGERLYIASRNKVHRPRARKRTSSSGARVEGAFVAGSAHLSASTRRSSEVPLTLPSASVSSTNMSSSLFGGVPSSSSTTTSAANGQRAVNPRDYGYSKHNSNSLSNGGMSDFSSPPHSASTGGSSVILSSPFSPASSSKNGVPSSIRTGTSSKASQMLGLSSTSNRSPDMYMSQTATYLSNNSDGASTLNGNSRSQNYNQQSPTTSTGSGGKDSNPSPHQQQSHTRMTLKKARSLFTSGGSTKGNKEKTSNSNSPEAGMHSPTFGGSKPMGMGSYGDAYNSAPSISNLYNNSQSTLSHSKSHGSLQGAMYGSARPSNPPALPPVPGSGSGSTEAPYHPYAAASTRKASQPNLPSHTSRSASQTREKEEDVTCPVCLESLSIRLQGEKPHVVPLCGHKLHNECFETAYNITVREALGDDRMEGVRRKKRQPIGICGICRSEMRIGDPSEVGKNSKCLRFIRQEISRFSAGLYFIICSNAMWSTNRLQKATVLMLIISFSPPQNSLCYLVNQAGPGLPVSIHTRYILFRNTR